MALTALHSSTIFNNRSPNSLHPQGKNIMSVWTKIAAEQAQSNADLLASLTEAEKAELKKQLVNADSAQHSTIIGNFLRSKYESANKPPAELPRPGNAPVEPKQVPGDRLGNIARRAQFERDRLAYEGAVKAYSANQKALAEFYKSRDAQVSAQIPTLLNGLQDSLRYGVVSRNATAREGIQQLRNRELDDLRSAADAGDASAQYLIRQIGLRVGPNGEYIHNNLTDDDWADISVTASDHRSGRYEGRASRAVDPSIIDTSKTTIPVSMSDIPDPLENAVPVAPSGKPSGPGASTDSGPTASQLFNAETKAQADRPSQANANAFTAAPSRGQAAALAKAREARETAGRKAISDLGDLANRAGKGFMDVAAKASKDREAAAANTRRNYMIAGGAGLGILGGGALLTYLLSRRKKPAYEQE